MKRTKVTDSQEFAFPSDQIFRLLVDFSRYPEWWPKELKVEVLKVSPSWVGSRIKIQPYGSWFVCEVISLIPNQEMLMHYVDGLHRGTGLWKLEEIPIGTRLNYTVDLEPQGVVPRLLSHVMDFAAWHSRGMQGVFSGLQKEVSGSRP